MYTNEEYQRDKEKLGPDWYCPREYHIFGEAPVWINHKRPCEILFRLNGELMSRKKAYEYLKEHWEPVTQTEIIWKLYRMKSYFGVKEECK
ncbi:MAG: hypothetical protein JXB26_01155 [Candidatus Aminicenantes bacterium]|nr:hypothetical protein [Candidatus Aminicenantes bacterium]